MRDGIDITKVGMRFTVHLDDKYPTMEVGPQELSATEPMVVVPIVQFTADRAHGMGIRIESLEA